MSFQFAIVLLCLVATPICRGRITEDERSWNDDDDESNDDSDDRSNEETRPSNEEELGGLARYGPAPLGHNGQVVDTGEVEHAKDLHFQAYAKMASLAAQHGGGRNRGAADDRNTGRGMLQLIIITSK